MSTTKEFYNVSKQYHLCLVSNRNLFANHHRWWTMNIRGKEYQYLKIDSVNDQPTVSGCENFGTLRNIEIKKLWQYREHTVPFVKRNNLSAMTTKYRDLHVLFSFIVSLWMYATPIVYPLSLVKGKVIAGFDLDLLMHLNPVTPIIETFKYGFLSAGEFIGWGWLASSPSASSSSTRFRRVLWIRCNMNKTEQPTQTNKLLCNGFINVCGALISHC